MIQVTKQFIIEMSLNEEDSQLLIDHLKATSKPSLVGSGLANLLRKQLNSGNGKTTRSVAEESTGTQP